VAAVVFAALWWGERAEDARRAEVEETARAFLAALTNFEAATIDQDVTEIRSYAVGGFAREVDETFSAERVEAIRTNEATSQGTVRTVVVHRLEEDTASAFGVVDETVTNSASPEPRTDVLRGGARPDRDIGGVEPRGDPPDSFHRPGRIGRGRPREPAPRASRVSSVADQGLRTWPRWRREDRRDRPSN
jgi:hypothetical protein